VVSPEHEVGLTIRLIDDARAWDELVEQLDGRLLQSWRWGELKSRHGWKPIRLAWLDSTGHPAIAAQLLFRRVGPLSIGYVPRGPLVAEGASYTARDRSYTHAVDRIARREWAICVLAEPEDEGGCTVLTGASGWQRSPTVIQPQRTVRVAIDVDDQTLLARMKPKTRYNIRLAERRGVQVRLGTAADLPAFYELLRETSERDRFGIHRIEYFRDILEIFGEDAALVIAEKEGEPAASALVVRFGAEAVYLYGASAARHQRHMASYLVQLAAMRWARERGCRVYDLWGIPPTDEPPDDIPDDQLNVRQGLWGVYRFKAGFGGQVRSYPGSYERIYSRPLVWLWRRLRSMEG